MLAAVLTAVIELVDVHSLRRLYGIWTERLAVTYGHAARADFIAAVVALAGVLVLETLPGLLTGVVVSLLLLLYRSSEPMVRPLTRVGSGWLDAQAHQDGPPDPAVLVVRVEGGLFFANADHVRSRLLDLVDPQTRLVVLDGQTSPFIDITAASMLEELAATLAPRGITLAAAGSIGTVRDVVRAASAEGALALSPSVDDAIAAHRHGS